VVIVQTPAAPAAPWHKPVGHSITQHILRE
jgi:hypothetical protein